MTRVGRIGKLAVTLPAAAAGQPATARPDPDALARAVREIERLDTLRSSLAVAFGAQGRSAHQATFPAGLPVRGRRGRRIARDNGWTTIHLAEC